MSGPCTDPSAAPATPAATPDADGRWSRRRAPPSWNPIATDGFVAPMAIPEQPSSASERRSSEDDEVSPVVMRTLRQPRQRASSSAAR